MIHKRVIYKRKLRGFLVLFFLSFLIFLSVFGICMGVWYMSSLHKQLLSPLPNVLNGTMAMKKSQEIQNLCVAQHIVCTNIIIHTDQTATITVEGSGEVILSLKKDLAQQITSLQLTIRQLTINDKRFRRLDFRFDRPVLTYE